MGPQGFRQIEKFFEMMQAGLDGNPQTPIKTINGVELSTMTWEDAMAFVGADYAVAA